MFFHPKMQGRLYTAVAAGWLLAVAGVFTRLLVANPSDNAYLWVYLVGAAMVPVAGAFGLAAILPYSVFRNFVIWLGVGLLWLLGGFGAVLLSIGVVIVLGQARFYQPSVFASPVFWNHVVGIVMLLPTLYLLGYRFPRAGAIPGQDQARAGERGEQSHDP